MGLYSFISLTIFLYHCIVAFRCLKMAASNCTCKSCVLYLRICIRISLGGYQVPENINPPPTEGNGIFLGGGL